MPEIKGRSFSYVTFDDIVGKDVPLEFSIRSLLATTAGTVMPLPLSKPRTFTTTVPEPEPGIAVQLGKFYRNRSGGKIGPMVANTWGDRDSYPFRGRDWSLEDTGVADSYTARGFFAIPGAENPYDLVAEWTDTPEPPPVPKAGPPIASFLDYFTDQHGAPGFVYGLDRPWNAWTPGHEQLRLSDALFVRVVLGFVSSDRRGRTRPAYVEAARRVEGPWVLFWSGVTEEPRASDPYAFLRHIGLDMEIE